MRGSARGLSSRGMLFWLVFALVDFYLFSQVLFFSKRFLQFRPCISKWSQLVLCFSGTKPLRQTTPTGGFTDSPRPLPEVISRGSDCVLSCSVWLSLHWPEVSRETLREIRWTLDEELFRCSWLSVERILQEFRSPKDASFSAFYVCVMCHNTGLVRIWTWLSCDLTVMWLMTLELQPQDLLPDILRYTHLATFTSSQVADGLYWSWVHKLRTLPSRDLGFSPHVFFLPRCHSFQHMSSLTHLHVL